MSAREWIARLQALCDAATPEPWYVYQYSDMPTVVAGTPNPDLELGGDHVADFARPMARAKHMVADSKFTAEARSALPAALACLTEILDRAEEDFTHFVGVGQIRAIIDRHLGGSRG